MNEKVIQRLKRVWRVLRWSLLGIAIIALAGSLVMLSEMYFHKSLWDWLDLFIIPLVLALGALWFNARSSQTEREIASERNQEAALQNYLDKMTELLLEKGLRTSAPEDEVRTVARTRTLTVLRGLEKERKTAVAQFLLESGLIRVQEQQGKDATSVISLQGADLRGVRLHGVILRGVNLRGANLSKATLREIHLDEANLRGTDLSGADLFAANLYGADLPRANLRGANLYGTDLRGAALGGADLHGARLVGANLRGANLGGADLRGATLGGANLPGAILPNGDTWHAGYDLSRFGVKTE